MSEQNITISKKKLYVIGGIILLILLVLVVFLVKATNKVENKEQILQEQKEIVRGKKLEKTDDITNNATSSQKEEIGKDISNKKEEVKNEISMEDETQKDGIRSGYKKVSINDGENIVSFAVPNEWDVETRHSGDKKISIDEMRDFLADHVDPFSLDFLSKYNDQEIESQFYGKGEYPKDFPTASVSANNISYSDMSGGQIDFNFKSEKVKSIVDKVKKAESDYCKDKPTEFVGCGMNISNWSENSVNGRKVYVENYAMDKDEQGNEISTKGGSGGKVYYIGNSDKTLVIVKQAKGDSKFEGDFDYLIQTLEFN